MTIQWLGAPRTLGQAGCRVPPCPPGNRRVFDPSCPSVTSSTPGVTLEPIGTVRCEPAAFEPCPEGQASYGAANCVPIRCPPGTVRDLSNFECVPELARPPLPIGPLQPGALPIVPTGSACLTAQQVVAAQPCFYFDQAGDYVGPTELVQGVDIAQLRALCLQSLAAGHFDLPLCPGDAAALPAPPSCIDPETRRILTYCTQQGATGPDRFANYFCWLANKSGPLFGEWLRTPNCDGTAPTESTTPPAQRRSLAAPLLIGAAIIAGVALLMSA